jgi:hypothetical protein
MAPLGNVEIRVKTRTKAQPPNDENNPKIHPIFFLHHPPPPPLLEPREPSSAQ